jgi:hypothetical protein
MEVRVSFVPLPLYSQAKINQYLLDKGLTGSQSWFVCCGGKRNLLPVLEIEP